MLTGTRVRLRAWCTSDLAALQALRNDVDLQLQLMAEPRPNSLDRVRTWLTERSSAPNGLLFVIAEASTDEAIGFLQVTDLDRRNRTANFGIGLARGAQGGGRGAEAMALLETYLVRVFDLRKLLLQVIDSNQGAQRFYARLGYRIAGRLAAQHLSEGRFVDVVIMEKLLTSDELPRP